jgi:hypothetical protein
VKIQLISTLVLGAFAFCLPGVAASSRNAISQAAAAYNNMVNDLSVGAIQKLSGIIEKDAESLASYAKENGITSLPHVANLGNDTLKVDSSPAYVIKVVNAEAGKFIINGKAFQLVSTKSASEQLKALELLLTGKTHTHGSLSSRISELLITSAHADFGVLIGLFAVICVLYAVVAFAMQMAGWHDLGKELKAKISSCETELAAIKSKPLVIGSDKAQLDTLLTSLKAAMKTANEARELSKNDTQRDDLLQKLNECTEKLIAEYQSAANQQGYKVNYSITKEYPSTERYDTSTVSVDKAAVAH